MPSELEEFWDLRQSLKEEKMESKVFHWSITIFYPPDHIGGQIYADMYVEPTCHNCHFLIALLVV
jgi:hypothetical protein